MNYWFAFDDSGEVFLEESRIHSEIVKRFVIFDLQREKQLGGRM